MVKSTFVVSCILFLAGIVGIIVGIGMSAGEVPQLIVAFFVFGSSIIGAIGMYKMSQPYTLY